MIIKIDGLEDNQEIVVNGNSIHIDDKDDDTGKLVIINKAAALEFMKDFNDIHIANKDKKLLDKYDINSEADFVAINDLIRIIYGTSIKENQYKNVRNVSKYILNDIERSKEFIYRFEYYNMKELIKYYGAGQTTIYRIRDRVKTKYGHDVDIVNLPDYDDIL